MMRIDRVSRLFLFSLTVLPSQSRSSDLRNRRTWFLVVSIIGRRTRRMMSKYIMQKEGKKNKRTHTHTPAFIFFPIAYIISFQKKKRAPKYLFSWIFILIKWQEKEKVSIYRLLFYIFVWNYRDEEQQSVYLLYLNTKKKRNIHQSIVFFSFFFSCRKYPSYIYNFFLPKKEKKHEVVVIHYFYRININNIYIYIYFPSSFVYKIKTILNHDNKWSSDPNNRFTWHSLWNSKLQRNRINFYSDQKKIFRKHTHTKHLEWSKFCRW